MVRPTEALPAVSVLLVDDRPENLLALEAILTDLGQPLVCATSGKEALRRILDEDFAAILLDVQMPGMDGMETARMVRARERSRRTPIIFLTAAPPTQQAMVEAYSLGGVDFVVKPLIPEVLRAKVTTLVHLAQASGEVLRLNSDLEERVQVRTNELQTAHDLHHDAEERLLLLADASSTLLGTLDPQAVIAEILRLAQRLLPAHAYAVWRVDPESGDWRSVADLHLPPQFPRSIPASTIRLLDHPLYIEDVTAEAILAGRQDAYRMEHVRSLLCVPLCVNGENSGTITAYYNRPHRFTEVEKRVARALASLAASALGSAELYAQQSRMRRVAEDAQARLSFLADASRILAASLETDTTLERLANLLVPRIADWCVVSLLEPDGSIRPLSVAHSDPAKVEWAREISRRYPPDRDPSRGIARVMRTGQSELHTHVTDAQIAAVARDEEHLRLLRQIGFSSVMMVPLVARGQVFGAISFVAAESGVHFNEADLALAEDLADRAAVAIDNAKLYHEARQADESIRYVMEHAHCLLWHAYVAAPERPGEPYRWDLRVFDEEAAQRFLPLEVLSGETYAHALHRSRYPEDQVLVNRNARAALDGKRPGYHQEYRCVGKDGRVRWLAEATQLYEIRPGRWRAVGVCTDITERKQSEEALRERADALAEADRRKDEFLRMLAHELRNPLGVVSNALHVMRSTTPESAAFRRAAVTAHRQVEHQTRLVNDLLDVSRITRGRLELQPEPLELARLVAETVEDHRGALDAAGLTLHLEIAPEPLPMVGDPTRLAQTVSNLLDNAAKFTPAGGTVSVRLAPDPGGSLAELTVRDTGIGIEPELVPLVFDTFMQADRTLDRSRGGLGLGLSIVKGLVELHGGTVRAASEGAGRGAMFTILLPLAGPVSPVAGRGSNGRGTAEPQPRASNAKPETENPETESRLHILVVEDNADAAETLRDLLELFGYRVRVAGTGVDGLLLARELHPQVVLCDIGLPGMDGYQVARELRKLPGAGDTHLIAITGYGGAEEQQRAREAGFDVHLTKPVNPDVLLETLASVRELCAAEP